ncbi:MAG: hypothetical protein LKF69_03035, partial [Bacilli bacterium]|nr:hypothetical protein [Bacilli bacterium]
FSSALISLWGLTFFWMVSNKAIRTKYNIVSKYEKQIISIAIVAFLSTNKAMPNPRISMKKNTGIKNNIK